jgi:predicted transcriptional regulator of viral defense system
MAAQRTMVDEARRMAHRRGVVRPRDLVEAGLPGYYLHRLWRQGELERIERGLYRWPDAPVTEHHSLVEVAAKVPGGVVCLLSALSFHGLTTQCPEVVWLAVGRRAHVPRTGLPLKLVRFPRRALSLGVVTHRLEGVEVPVTNVAKTVCDLYKYRHRVGLDVAEEALQEAWQRHLIDPTTLLGYARTCRVAGVLGQDLERLG